MGSLPQGWWVAALPGAGSLPEGTCGCLRGSGGHADGRGSAGSNLACGKCKERETGDTGEIHSPVVFLQLVGKFGVSMARKARASPGHCSGSTVSKLRCCNQSFL